MSKSSVPSTAAAPTSSLFGPPPFLEGEDSSAYNELLARVSGRVKPADMLEEIWVLDVVDLTWQIFRWRRLMGNLTKATEHEGVQAVLVPILGLNGISPAQDAVMALTLAEIISEIERMDRLIMNSELRRNAALHEIERHRASFGQALRRASDDVVDAQFEQVQAPQIDDRKEAA
jgi:hypothetical protein